MTATRASTSPVVLYDGGCPLCRREIAHYRRLRALRELHWVDIARPDFAARAWGVSHAAALAQFHVRDAHGEWHIGAHGFVELWSHLPVYRHLAGLLRLLRLTPLLDRAYRRFARWRLARRCDSTRCVPARVAQAPAGTRRPRTGRPRDQVPVRYHAPGAPRPDPDGGSQ